MATNTRYRFSASELFNLTGWNQVVIDDYLESQTETIEINETIEQIQFEIDELQDDIIDINNELNAVNLRIDNVEIDVAQNTLDIAQNASDIAELESSTEGDTDGSTALALSRQALSDIKTLNELIESIPDAAPLVLSLSKKLSELRDSIEGIDSNNRNAGYERRLIELEANAFLGEELAAINANQSKRIKALEDLVASLV